MGKLAYLYHPVFELHHPGPAHPERPERVKVIHDFLTSHNFFNKIELVKPDKIAQEVLELVHTRQYIDFLYSKQGVEYAMLDEGDTVINQYSIDAALIAAGAAVKAVDLISNNGFDKIFAAVRPPGHHAEAGKAMGFCLINNIAVAAAYALQTGLYHNILIIDWDVHHGNGTQNTFYENPHVFYFSMHRFPFYPGTGRRDETGRGKGKGYTLNIPMAGGTGDNLYIEQLEKALMKIEQKIKPDLILISSGFDAHEKDPLGGMLVTDNGYYKMTELTAKFAQKHCSGRIISFLEGGYNLQALAAGVYQHLSCLLKH
ncbi:MAG: histone deacetylase [Calditrichaceae bacterium]|nr:histone deacetylase [Calditrichaceae bacterium]MBN2707782.1 histone deacetylase [Calditrichaceae bacterium]